MCCLLKGSFRKMWSLVIGMSSILILENFDQTGIEPNIDIF